MRATLARARLAFNLCVENRGQATFPMAGTIAAGAAGEALDWLSANRRPRTRRCAIRMCD